MFDLAVYLRLCLAWEKFFFIGDHTVSSVPCDSGATSKYGVARNKVYEQEDSVEDIGCILCPGVWPAPGEI